MIIKIEELQVPRLRVRRIDEMSIAQQAQRRAIEENRWVIWIEHGGGVANCYGYPAETECALVVSDPCGCVFVWTGRTSARGVTDRSAAESCFPGSGDLFDGRVKSPTRLSNARNIIKESHAKKFAPLEVLSSI